MSRSSIHEYLLTTLSLQQPWALLNVIRNMSTSLPGLWNDRRTIEGHQLLNAQRASALDGLQSFEYKMVTLEGPLSLSQE